MLGTFRHLRFATLFLVLMASWGGGGCSAKVNGDGTDRSGQGGASSVGGQGGSGGAKNGGAGNGGSAGGSGGTGRADGATVDAPGLADAAKVVPTSGPLTPATTVVISEIMYHPVQENADEDNHEFVEIFNRSQSPVDLGGWTLDSGKSGIQFTFPEGTTIDPGTYKVVAKNRQMLATVWGLAAGDLLGDYMGGLANRSDTVSLTTRTGDTMDSVKYDAVPPWPIAADALGVGEEWLTGDQLPILKHQYKGRSLERISTDWASNNPANWEASALDKATPGAANSVAGTVRPVANLPTASPMGGMGPLIHANEMVTVAVSFSDFEPVEGVQIKFFYDDITKSNEPQTTMPMSQAGADKHYEITMPAMPDNTLVRYQIFATRGGKMEQVSPRATDPNPWNSYFVSPVVQTTSRVYHLFMTPENWTQLEKWLAIGRNMDTCTWNAGWDKDLPATFIYNGEVYDVVASYSGSRYQRKNGPVIAKWTAPGPTVPPARIFSAYSWKVKFPNYKPFEGQNTIKLNKQFQGFPGTVSIVEGGLLEKIGVPSYKTNYARLHINGSYYNYMEQNEQIDSTMLARYLAKGEKAGDMYKADGASGDDGPAFRADFTPIVTNSACPKIPIADRYDATYPRATYNYRGSAAIIKLIGDLDAAVKKGGGVSADVKQYFETNWDVDLMAKVYAVRNWSGVWDDTFHNQYPYKQPSNGKWVPVQQDFEWDFGLGQEGLEQGLALWRANVTLYLGAYKDLPIGKTCETTIVPTKEENRCNNLGFSRLKDLFIQNYRQKYDDTMKELAKDILAKDNVLKMVDDAVMLFSQADWDASPTNKMFCKDATSGQSTLCNVDKAHQLMRKWVTDRAAQVTLKLGM